MKLYVCRHGQTTGDVEDRYGGDYDDRLTKLGRKQAGKLSKQLQDKNIEIIFSSSLIRAKETAEVLSKALSLEVVEMDNLKERNWFGILTGMVKSKAKKLHPELVEQSKNYMNTIDEAEGQESFSKRIHEALKEISQKDHKVVAVVTHGGPIKAILRKIKYAPDYKIEDCAFAELETADNKLNVVGLHGIEPTTG
jgi:broad specificity phosphatase PhoE